MRLTPAAARALPLKTPAFASTTPRNIQAPRFGTMDLFQRRYNDSGNEPFQAKLSDTANYIPLITRLYGHQQQAALRKEHAVDGDLPAGKNDMTGTSVLAAVEKAQTKYTIPGQTITAERFLHGLDLFKNDGEKEAARSALRELADAGFITPQPKTGYVTKFPKEFVFQNTGLQEEMALTDLAQVALDPSLHDAPCNHAWENQ